MKVGADVEKTVGVVVGRGEGCFVGDKVGEEEGDLVVKGTAVGTVHDGT